MKIGPYSLPNRIFVAPMAGVTDRPFRALCRQLGAGYAVSEMVTSKRELWKSLKTSRRTDHTGEAGPIAVQIAGTQAQEMAQAALYNMERGAQIIDINMGCPAKKVCDRWAGSALMRDEPLAIEIMREVVRVCEPLGVPVTLKMRTGWCAQSLNAVSLAKAAEDSGIQMLTVHGRTREQRFSGAAQYDIIQAVKAAVSIPVVANGDIDSPQKALQVLQFTQADAVMVGRAAQGRPWIFREIDHYLTHGVPLATPQVLEVKDWLMAHLLSHYELYGDEMGVRSARKHVGWYIKHLRGEQAFRQAFNRIEHPQEQMATLTDYLDELACDTPHWPSHEPYCETDRLQ
jgi:tRNA-dihydrouridine synthase B